ncbi:MAG TPA: hypothetical protein VFV98_19430, partial [Vicinamibacterales bacterium]|nr:hypothetical protein [Vicinamibacterales bacterium]
AMTIVLTATEFKVTMGAGERVETIVLKTDGSETEIDHGNKGKAEWKATSWWRRSCRAAGRRR